MPQPNIIDPGRGLVNSFPLYLASGFVYLKGCEVCVGNWLEDGHDDWFGKM
jgi:hypothetical protein